MTLGNQYVLEALHKQQRLKDTYSILFVVFLQAVMFLAINFQGSLSQRPSISN